MSGQRASHFERAQVNRLFGYEFVSRSDTQAEIRLPLKDSFLQVEGVVQGGVISALADTAGVYILYPDLPEGTTMTSIEFKINFLRAAVLDGGDVSARSTLVKKGRRIAFCEVEVFQQDEIIAKGLFTYLLFK